MYVNSLFGALTLASIAWGAILMITAGCNNFTGMAICRFLLGCFEGIMITTLAGNS